MQRSGLAPLRVLMIADKRTTVRLEHSMWEALGDIAARQGRTIHQIATEIDQIAVAPSRTAAIRIYIVEFYRNQLASYSGSAPDEASPDHFTGDGQASQLRRN